MHHELTLITTIAASLGVALVLGLLANRLRLPALIGYLVAGVILGPATPGFVADQALSGQLAEIGVMLLMFGVGLHFSFDDLLAVRRIALPGALGQIAVATTLGVGTAMLWGWSFGAGLVFGLALSVASTVVLLRALEQRGSLQTVTGRIAVGWLVVEDLVMVLVLVVVPPLAGLLGAGAAGAPALDGRLAARLLGTLGGLAAFVALMLFVGRKVFPWLLWQVAGTGSRELFTLAVIAAAVGVAYGSSELFGVSFAIGAFFAGMVLRESPLSHRAAEESLPLRDAFSVLFFVSVGMLFDPKVVLGEPLKLVAVVAIIIVGKSLAAFGILLVARYPLNAALTVSASLAQVGEFSFILVGLGVSLGLLPREGQSLVLAGALISIAVNPLVFGAIGPAQRWILGRSRWARAFERPHDPLAELPDTVEPKHVTGHVVIAGYGRVGRRVGETLASRGVPFVAAEEDRELVEALRAAGVPAVAGDVIDAHVLVQAHVGRAAQLVIAIPDASRAHGIIETARMLNPKIDIVVRSHNEEEAALLRDRDHATVLLGEHELADSMARRVLERRGATEGGTT